MTDVLIAQKRFEGLPENVTRVLTDFISSAVAAFGSDLKSAVLYGSGAEGRLRAASDVNLLLILSAFDAVKADAIRQPFAAAHAAIQLTTMFLLETEFEPAMTAFGQKFSDTDAAAPSALRTRSIRRRQYSAGAVILRLKQVLLNLALRLREAFIEQGSTPERLAGLIADSAGPLRSCAATLLELEAKPALAPKEALIQFVSGFGEPGWEEILAHVSEARDGRPLSAETADATLFRMIELAARLRVRAEALQ